MSDVTKPSKLTYDKERRTIITQPRQIIWLREVDAGTDNACRLSDALNEEASLGEVTLYLSLFGSH